MIREPLMMDDILQAIHLEASLQQLQDYYERPPSSSMRGMLLILFQSFKMR